MVHRRTEREKGAEAPAAKEPQHLSCPFCSSYDINRLYLASLGLDSCDCAACGARWDESKATGEYRGRAHRASVVIPRPS
ncbi:MAG: hypothetical protein NVSMB12_03440 [Acidimicrobiales bacterium]